MSDWLLEPTRLNVLFLCTGNSSRSIMAEGILNSLGGRRFIGYSAGSRPNDRVHPFALEVLRHSRLSTEGLRSKSWNEFSRPNAPFMHFVFTVCDQAAAEPCPVWPGKPITAHWSIRDPASVEGNDDTKRRAFQNAFNDLQRRIFLFINLPFDALKGFALKARLDDIGHISKPVF